MSQKASRLDKVERVLGEVIQAIQQQGDALNFLLAKVKELDPNEIEVKDEEVVDPNQKTLEL